MRIRKLNEKGTQTFRDFLRGARASGSSVQDAPTTILSLPTTSEEIPDAPELETLPTSTNRYELASYLVGKFARLDRVILEGRDGIGDPGFWAALSLYYFELLTPGYRKNGNRVLADNCCIPEVNTTMAGVRYFRHRIAGAYRLFNLYRELSQPLLLSKAGVQDALYAAITDSVFYTETRCVVEAVGLLYFDPTQGRLKLGWNSHEKPGALPRLLAVIDQLDLTYDLQGISGPGLLAQLPREFDSWNPEAHRPLFDAKPV